MGPGDYALGEIMQNLIQIINGELPAGIDGKKVKFFIPPAVANIAGHMMEAIAKKKGEKPVLTTFNVYNLTRNNRFDCTKAREELGYMTRSYEETIHDMVEWLIAEGFIQKEA